MKKIDKILSPIKERILYYIDFKKIKKETFFQKTDIVRSNFSGTGAKSEFGGDKIAKILNEYPDINPDWLLTGTGEMLRSQNIHSSTHTHTGDAEQTAQNQREDTQKMIEGGTVILFDAEAAAGYGSFSEVLSKEKIAGYYNVPGLNHADFLIPISGSSMFPKYASGDILAAKIIDDPQFLQWGRPYIIATRDQGMLCKRIYESGQEDYINVVSENPKYDPFDIPKDDILGFAIVVGVIHRE